MCNKGSKLKATTYSNAEYRAEYAGLRKQVRDTEGLYIIYKIDKPVLVETKTDKKAFTRPNVVITVCVIRAKDGKLSRGVSITSPTDNYCAIVGKIHAMRRALKANELRCVDSEVDEDGHFEKFSEFITNEDIYDAISKLVDAITQEEFEYYFSDYFTLYDSITPYPKCEFDVHITRNEVNMFTLKEQKFAERKARAVENE